MKDIHSPAPTQPNPLGHKTDKISNNREGLEVSKEIKSKLLFTVLYFLVFAL